MRWKIILKLLKCGKIYINKQKLIFCAKECQVTLTIDFVACHSKDTCGCFHPTFLLLLSNSHGELYPDRPLLALMRPYETLQLCC